MGPQIILHHEKDIRLLLLLPRSVTRLCNLKIHISPSNRNSRETYTLRQNTYSANSVPYMPTERKAEVIQQKHTAYKGIQIHVSAPKWQKHIFKLQNCMYCKISSRQERKWHMLAKWCAVTKSACAANRLHKILPKHIYYRRAQYTSFLCILQRKMKEFRMALRTGALSYSLK